MDFLEIGAKFFVYFIPFLFALSFHEYAHGWVARLRGDRTAQMMGRLTLNPMAHADPIGTIALPMLAIATGFPFFGWAKPVPVDERNFKDPKNDMFWVALAGPMSNILLATVAALILGLSLRIQLSPANREASLQFLQAFVFINLFLAFFNLLPFHPLDGGKVIARFLPYSANKFLEDHQGTLSWILIGAFILGGFKFLAIPVYHVARLLFQMAGVPF
jgi:Zn-dependent protease